MCLIPLSKKISFLGTNLFNEMDMLKGEVQKKGKQLIDLSIGSSDLNTSKHVLNTIANNVLEPDTNGYTLFRDTAEFRQAACKWYERKFGVPVDPKTEVIPLIGSQEGTAHLSLAVLDEGDVALIQDPGYPAHAGSIHLAGGQVYPMPIVAENDFLPKLSDIPLIVLEQTRLMILSYPHNPTTAIATLDFFQEAVAFCQQHGIVLVHDFPYADLFFEGAQVPSVLQADPDKSVSIEFFTLSKSYNMGGFRVGYAIGNSTLVNALRQVKSIVDFNQYRGILCGGIAALTGPQNCVSQTVKVFAARRDVAVQALREIGWQVPTPKATMYIWAKLPETLPHGWATRSTEFCSELLLQTGVALAPGRGFGKTGEGYVRFALVQPSETLKVAISRMGAFIDSFR